MKYKNVKLEMNVCRFLSEGNLVSQSLKAKDYCAVRSIKYRALLPKQNREMAKVNSEDLVLYLN